MLQRKNTCGYIQGIRHSEMGLFFVFPKKSSLNNITMKSFSHTRMPQIDFQLYSPVIEITFSSAKQNQPYSVRQTYTISYRISIIVIAAISHTQYVTQTENPIIPFTPKARPASPISSPIELRQSGDKARVYIHRGAARAVGARAEGKSRHHTGWRYFLPHRLRASGTPRTVQYSARAYTHARPRAAATNSPASAHVVPLLILILVKGVEKLEGWHRRPAARERERESAGGWLCRPLCSAPLCVRAAARARVDDETIRGG